MRSLRVALFIDGVLMMAERINDTWHHIALDEEEADWVYDDEDDYVGFNPVLNWIDENIRGRLAVFFKPAGTGDGVYFDHDIGHFYFEEKTDYIAFKLRWEE